jgi:hypothetical protein
VLDSSGGDTHTIPLSAFGLLLGGFGFILSVKRRGAGVGYPVAGGLVCCLALAIGIVQVAVVGSVGHAISQVNEERTRTNQQSVGRRSDAPSRTLPPFSAATGTPSNPGPTTGPAENKPAEPEWASAHQAVRQGDVEIKVTQVLLGKVPLRSKIDQSESVSQDDLIAICVELRNVSQSRKVEYESWLGRHLAFGRDHATLKDNFGNVYKRIDFGFGTEIIGHTESDSIYPGKMLRDALVFEVPVETAKYLDLELPAANFGGEGMLRLRIPSDMINRR